MTPPVDETRLLWIAVASLWGIVIALLGVVWRNLNWRINQHEDRLRAVDSSVLYLRDQGHDLRNLIPLPVEVEARRRETRENFDRIFAMLREIERAQNEMAGELKARRKDHRGQHDV